MIAQIADRAHAESLRFSATYDQRIRAIKPERFGYPNAKFGERITNFIEQPRAVRFQNLLRDGTRVFRASADLFSVQCLAEHDRTTHAVPAFRSDAGFVQCRFSN